MNMKKYIALLLAAVMLFSMTACGKDKPVEPEKLKAVPDADAEPRSLQGLGHFVSYMDKRGNEKYREYQTTPREFKLTAGFHEENMQVRVTVGYPKTEPFKNFEALGIGEYQLLDAYDQVVTSDKNTEAFPISEKTAVISFALPGEMQLETGIYHIEVRTLIAQQKEGTPVTLAGPWKFTFSID